jgi:hypothetical protein
MKKKIPVAPEKGLSRLCLLAACAPSAPQVNSTPQASAFPVLASILASFGTASIGNAPTFTEVGTGAAFSAYPPQLAPGMDLTASGEPGRSCSVTVKGYGRVRPMPAVRDINRLGQTLHALSAEPSAPRSSQVTGAQRSERTGTFIVSSVTSPPQAISAWVCPELRGAAQWSCPPPPHIGHLSAGGWRRSLRSAGCFARCPTGQNCTRRKIRMVTEPPER